MKREIKVETIPILESWKNVLPWILEINNIIRMGALPPAGTLSNDVAKMIPTRLKGEVKMWYYAQDETAKQWLTDTWVNLFTGIIRFLGPSWSTTMRQELLSMRYRQRGHDRETPMELFIRKINHTRLLVSVPPGQGLVDL